eukprot:3587503-Prymnesium_polylepis.1
MLGGGGRRRTGVRAALVFACAASCYHVASVSGAVPVVLAGARWRCCLLCVGARGFVCLLARGSFGGIDRNGGTARQRARVGECGPGREPVVESAPPAVWGSGVSGGRDGPQAPHAHGYVEIALVASAVGDEFNKMSLALQGELGE